MTVLCFIDTETTGLDPRIHQPYEVSWWREDRSEPHTTWLPHTLKYADAKALDIGEYWDRIGGPWSTRCDGTRERDLLIHQLQGVTLVGANPAFDAAMLTKVIGAPVWHYRLIDIEAIAMWQFGWDRPKSLLNVAAECRQRGHEIPEPDHTAEGDVRATRAVYDALHAIRAERGNR